MKKIFGLLAIAGLFVATSCTKDYECCWTTGGLETCTPYPGLDSDEASATQTTCENALGTWREK